MIDLPLMDDLQRQLGGEPSEELRKLAADDESAWEAKQKAHDDWHSVRVRYRNKFQEEKKAIDREKLRQEILAAMESGKAN